MATIAFIGLGNMGNPMAANLVKAGHTVRGFDLVKANLDIAEANGVTIVTDALAAVDGSDTVITMLPAGKHVLAVYADIVPVASKGTLFIDSSTIDVESARKAHGLAAAAGMPQDAAPDAEVSRDVVRKVLGASFVGNFVEWFDYASYGYFATVIAHAFFPEIAPTSALLATFAVFAISFIIRPVGGIIWGAIGDRVGRRTALSWSILIMSGATTVIALLPSYHQIGLLAPVLLLLVRMVQGFSAAGEYAGATSFIAEYSPTHRRGLYTSIVPASTAAGAASSTVT